MARFTGPQHRGAQREARAQRRLQAQTRNALYQLHKANRPERTTKGGAR